VISTLSGERGRPFVPPPLPPSPKALDVTSLQVILAEANQAVGRLDGITSALPDLKLFLYSYVRKEAGRNGSTSSCRGVRDTANQAPRTADSIDKLFRKDKEKIELFGQDAASALLIYRYAQANPLFSIKNAAREMKVSFPTTSSAMARLVKAGILRESSGKRRDRLFLYQNYLDILNQES
jgi:Fic family protein